MDGNTATGRFYKLLGARIARRRSSARLTQAQLAERIGSARTSVTNLERGRQQMPLHQLLRIAEVLQVDLKDLIPKILDEHDEANNDTGSKSGRAAKALQDQRAPSRRRGHRAEGRGESNLP